MFQIGDHIVYPMHGAGVIESIEEKEVLGEKQQYYVISMHISNMQVMIPTNRVSQSRIRLVSDMPTLEDTLQNFHHGQSDKILPMKERFKINTEKLKTGNLYEGAEVVRDLLRINKEKTLNSSEKHMLHSARAMFINELAVIKGITENQAVEMLKTIE